MISGHIFNRQDKTGLGDNARITYRPPIIHEQVEDAKNNDQHNSAELSLEPNHNHDTGNETEEANCDSPEAPVPSENEASEQEDQEHTSGELDIHLAILLIQLRQSSGDEPLADPGIREDHEQAANDGEVAQEEIQVEDKTVAESLRNDDAEKTGNSFLGVFAGDDQNGTGEHDDDIGDEEEVGDAPGDCEVHMSGQEIVIRRSGCGKNSKLTAPVIAQIE